MKDQELAGHGSRREMIAVSSGEVLLQELQMFGLLWGEIRGRGKPDLEGSHLSAKKFLCILKSMRDF